MATYAVQYDIAMTVAVYFDVDDEDGFEAEGKAEELATKLLDTPFKREILTPMFQKDLMWDPYIEVGFVEESTMCKPTCDPAKWLGGQA